VRLAGMLSCNGATAYVEIVQVGLDYDVLHTEVLEKNITTHSCHTFLIIISKQNI